MWALAIKGLDAAGALTRGCGSARVTVELGLTEFSCDPRSKSLRDKYFS